MIDSYFTFGGIVELSIELAKNYELLEILFLLQ